MKINMVKGDGARRGKRNQDESESDDEDDREYLNNQMFRYKH